MPFQLGNDADPSARLVRDMEKLSEIVQAVRTLGQSIVLTQGTFDLLHVGHAKYMATAKGHGDVLIVGVDSDEKVRDRKGPDRPIIPETERTEMLCYLSSVDFVIVKQLHAERWALIKLVQPDVLIATAETYSEAELDELQKYCGKVVVMEPMSETSTSAKIRKIHLGFAASVEQALSHALAQAMPRLVKSTVADLVSGTPHEETPS